MTKGKNKEELAKSIEDLRAEVRELREMVNMLVDIIVNMETIKVQDILVPKRFPLDGNKL